LQAPLARTTVRHLISPLPVATRYPSSCCVTDVTGVSVRTGAPVRTAKPEMKSITSRIVMKPSGSAPS
jgi:hypothetical protein